MMTGRPGTFKQCGPQNSVSVLRKGRKDSLRILKEQKSVTGATMTSTYQEQEPCFHRRTKERGLWLMRRNQNQNKLWN